MRERRGNLSCVDGLISCNFEEEKKEKEESWKEKKGK